MKLTSLRVIQPTRAKLSIFCAAALFLCLAPPCLAQDESSGFIGDTCLHVRPRLNALVDSLRQQGYDTLVSLFYRNLNRCDTAVGHFDPINETGFVFVKSASDNILIKIDCQYRQKTLVDLRNKLHFLYLAKNKDAILSYKLKEHWNYGRTEKEIMRCIRLRSYDTGIVVWLDGAKHEIDFPSYLLLDCGKTTDAALYNVETRLFTWLKILEEVIRVSENYGALDMRY